MEVASGFERSGKGELELELDISTGVIGAEEFASCMLSRIGVDGDGCSVLVSGSFVKGVSNPVGTPVAVGPLPAAPLGVPASPIVGVRGPIDETTGERERGERGSISGLAVERGWEEVWLAVRMARGTGECIRRGLPAARWGSGECSLGVTVLFRYPTPVGPVAPGSPNCVVGVAGCAALSCWPTAVSGPTEPLRPLERRLGWARLDGLKARCCWSRVEEELLEEAMFESRFEYVGELDPPIPIPIPIPP